MGRKEEEAKTTREGRKEGRKEGKPYFKLFTIITKGNYSFTLSFPKLMYPSSTVFLLKEFISLVDPLD